MAKDVEHLVVAIDGPAGSGKSTVSKLVAKSLGLLYIDTGAMYRALTLKALRSGIDLDDADAVTALARSTRIDLKEEGGSLRVYLDGEDVSLDIRTPELTNKVKHVARIPSVRAEMVKQQRAIGERSGAVLEGRDIGTVVFPDAKFKFYLDADVEERARRRYKELVEANQKVEFEDIKKDVLLRDESDMKRDVGALKKAADAIFVDTTHLSVEEVVNRLLSYIR
ncbi:MAG: (d)CMP kinase [Candidatus Omnitrophica bacterium]|nr:(d)CMP kinase [Candidatus Omnitrophota bacterium]